MKQRQARGAEGSQSAPRRPSCWRPRRRRHARSSPTTAARVRGARRRRRTDASSPSRRRGGRRDASGCPATGEPFAGRRSSPARRRNARTDPSGWSHLSTPASRANPAPRSNARFGFSPPAEPASRSLPAVRELPGSHSPRGANPGASSWTTRRSRSAAGRVTAKRRDELTPRLRIRRPRRRDPF